jgi:hypothetical protein
MLDHVNVKFECKQGKMLARLVGSRLIVTKKMDDDEEFETIKNQANIEAVYLFNENASLNEEGNIRFDDKFVGVGENLNRKLLVDEENEKKLQVNTPTLLCMKRVYNDFLITRH